VRVLVTGSHGLIGSALVAALRDAGHGVTRLVRADPGPGDVFWDPAAGAVDTGGLEGHDAVVHLAGAGIGDRRWSRAYKREIRDSRTRGTDVLVRALASLDRPPRVLASGSAVGVYGDRGDEELTESSPPGDGFLAEVVTAWEAATAPAQEAGIRVVHLRSGIVLSRHGGALPRLVTPMRLGAGGRLGSGRQWWSWITLDDEIGAIQHVLGRHDAHGPANLTAPAPVTNADFVAALGRVLHRPTRLPAPGFGLKLLLGAERAREILLAGQRVLPGVLRRTGYAFRHTGVDAGLAHVLG